MTKMHTKKIFQHLSNNNIDKEDDINDSSNNELKNQEILQYKLNNALPILFIFVNTKHYLFIMKK